MMMNIARLREVSLLSGLTDEELGIFNALLEFRTADDRERIVEEGGKIDAFYIIWDGVVHVRCMAQKREVLLGRIAKGGYFGEVNLYGLGTATASVYAMQEVTLASVPYDSLRKFIAEHPSAGCKITSRILTETCTRLVQANERFLSAIFWTSLSASPPVG